MLGLSEDTEDPVPSLQPVQVLLIGDRDDDATIIVEELAAVGFAPRWLRAATGAELRASIAGGGCDLVITGHAMAAIDSIEVLEVVRDCQTDLPVILLAGRIGEEAVAAAMRGGALDYVNLDNPARLGPAVRRCLAEVAARDQQRATEAALRESDAQLDEVHPIAEFGRWDWDIATNQVNWSHGLARVYGFEPGYVGSSAVRFLERIHEDDRSNVLAALQGAQASGEPFKLDFRIVRPDGEIRELWCRGAIVHDAQAQTVGIQGTAQDVTDLKQAERLASGLLESAPDGIVVVDEAGAIALVNAKLEQLLGYEREELVGAPVKRLIPERFHDQLANRIATFWARRADEPTAGSQEIRALTRDGRELPVEAAFGSLVGPGGALIFVAVRDITVRKAAEESLRSVNARLQAIFDHVPAGLALRGLDGRYLQINENAARVLGATPQELVGAPAPAVEFEPELVELLHRQDETIIGTGEPQTLDIVRPDEDGTDHEYRVVRYPVRDEQRGLIAFGTFTLDITHRVRAERQMQRALDDLLEAQRIAKLGSWGWDPATQTVTWSAEMYRIYGRDPAEGPAPDERYYGDVVAADRELMRTSHKRLFRTGQPFEIDYRILAGDGIERTVHALGRIDSDRPGVFSGTVQDVTELRAAEDELREAQERLRRAFEHAPIGMVVADLQTQILQVNPAFCAITGYRDAELVGTSYQRLTHPDDIGDDLELVEGLRSGEIESYQREKRYLRASGEPVWVSINGTLVRDSEGQPMQLLAQVVDVTERRTLERQLRHAADHDHLTGLLNRRGLEAELQQHVARVARYGARGALLVLDLDHFKVVNDTMGHSAGDQVIVSVAGLLIRRMRASDTIARVGGDEFAILLPEADAQSAQRVADMIVSDVRQNVVVVESGMPGRVTASVGVTLFNAEHSSVDDVLVNADLAMYDAKESGRDRTAVHVVDDQSESKMRARVNWIQRIRSAIEEERFTFEAQPIADLRTGECHQYELLLRMLGEDGENVLPGAFLSIAERYDLIGELDRWVAARAISIVEAQFIAGESLTVAVNLSGRSLGDAELLEVIEFELQRSRIPPTSMTFEVTEMAAVANIDLARHFAQRLSALGCRFALDDFGAGFGSFYYLKHIPFDYLKLDGEFVTKCIGNRTDQLVIESLVSIARGLDKRTIAECVEDGQTQRYLQSQGVDYAQGYHIGRPVPIEQVLKGRGAERP